MLKGAHTLFFHGLHANSERSEDSDRSQRSCPAADDETFGHHNHSTIARLPVDSERTEASDRSHRSRSAAGTDGYELHRRVDKARWCVTKDDMAQFKRRVRKAVKAGQIKPTSSDQFDPRDRRIGPSVYTVTEQLIKPVTRKAGNRSWALMLHPEGLECDLFITHAWQEGIFEFLDKVLHSWPRGARHAYCCMLANPQNLDIAQMICHPRCSPFAVALASAQHVLVVPNRATSIYTRLWCVYEAYLAYSSDKTIVVARSPDYARLLAVIGWAALVGCLGLLLGWQRHRLGVRLTWIETQSFWVACVVPILVAQIVRHEGIRRCFNVLGAGLAGYYIAVADMLTTNPAHYYHKRADDARREQILLSLALCYYLIAAADGARRQAAQREWDQLTAGYNGSVRHARCSVESDETAIRKEIRSSFAEVDQAIALLICSGMWNKSLRIASQAGVDVRHAGHVEYAVPCVCWSVHLVVAHFLFRLPSTYSLLLAVAIVAVNVFWLLFLLIAAQDSRVFAIKAACRLAPAWLLVHLVTHAICQLTFGVTVHDVRYANIHCTSLFVFDLFSVGLGFAGVGGVVRIPCCGSFLAQVLLVPNCCPSLLFDRKALDAPADDLQEGSQEQSPSEREDTQTTEADLEEGSAELPD